VVLLSVDGLYIIKLALHIKAQIDFQIQSASGLPDCTFNVDIMLYNIFEHINVFAHHTFIYADCNTNVHNNF